MGPLAIITAITTLNQLLLTPPGQTAFTNANEVFMNIFKLLHIHLAANTVPLPDKAA